MTMIDLYKDNMKLTTEKEEILGVKETITKGEEKKTEGALLWKIGDYMINCSLHSDRARMPHFLGL